VEALKMQNPNNRGHAAQTGIGDGARQH